jgi:hypothetical protein
MILNFRSQFYIPLQNKGSSLLKKRIKMLTQINELTEMEGTADSQAGVISVITHKWGPADGEY